MALLPIIYLSILITSGLIVIVVTVSYISSRLRNRGNGDRILAISNAGVNLGNTAIERPKVVIQTRTARPRTNTPARKAPVVKRASQTHHNHHEMDERVNLPSQPRVTRVFTQEHTLVENKYETQYEARVANSSTSEMRSSSQKHTRRVEVLNNTRQNTSSGNYNIQNASQNTPLYYYSHSNDQAFYTIKAS